jgi:hypothetical protein
MSRSEDPLFKLFEICLLRLQSGETLEAILAENPEHSDDLRPVLESVIAIWNTRGSDTVPVAAMFRSREQLLNARRNFKAEPKE